MLASKLLIRSCFNSGRSSCGCACKYQDQHLFYGTTATLNPCPGKPILSRRQFGELLGASGCCDTRTNGLDHQADFVASAAHVVVAMDDLDATPSLVDLLRGSRNHSLPSRSLHLTSLTARKHHRRHRIFCTTTASLPNQSTLNRVSGARLQSKSNLSQPCLPSDAAAAPRHNLRDSAGSWH